MRRLEGKTAVVTGAAGGIGARVAAMLGDQGCFVTGVDRGQAEECPANVPTDLADAGQLAALAEQLAAAPPDILVNVAGIARFGLHEAQTGDDVALCYQVNLVAPALLARAVAGPMRARGSGQIVNIGSVLGAIPYPWFAAYSSSKAGLAALSQGLRRELAGSGVSVTHISPRAAKTPFNDGQINRFLTLMGMTADDPELVARAIVGAIIAKRPHLTIGIKERFYCAVNALAPGLIDSGLAGPIRRARIEFS